MQPTLERALFDDPDFFFEPWWPGTRMAVFLEAGHLRLQTEHLGDPLGVFPELADLARSFVSDGIVVDGTLLVLDSNGRPDADLLRRRLQGRQKHSGHAAFVASDLLYRHAIALTAQPYSARREQMRDVVRDGDWCVGSRGVRGEGWTLANAVARMGIEAVSARRLDARYHHGPAGDAWFRLPVAETPAADTRPLLALIQRLPL